MTLLKIGAYGNAPYGCGCAGRLSIADIPRDEERRVWKRALRM